MKQYIKIIIVIFVAIGLIGGGIFGYQAHKSYEQQYTGEQWFAKQKKYVKQMETYSDEMDNVFALYLSKAIKEDDFLNHITILNGELKIMKVAYDKEKEEHPVRTGSHSYFTKKGCESIEDCYKTLNKILNMASKEENYSDVNVLGYKYLAYQEELIKEVSNYMAASQIINEEKGEVENE